MIPVLMKALELKCQITAVGCKHVILLLSLLIQYEIYYLSGKHVNFSYYNMKFKDSAIIYIYSKGQMKCLQFLAM